MQEQKICCECLRTYTAHSANGKYCPACRKVVNKRRAKEATERQSIRRMGSKSLREFQWEIKDFNEANGTNLSYGQYVAYKAGLLKI